MNNSGATKEKLDILIAAVPPVTIAAPPPGPAGLISVLKSHGFACRYVDLNIELFWQTKESPDQAYWLNNDTLIHNKSSFDEFYRKSYKTFCENWAESLAHVSTEWLGFSVMSYYAFPFLEKLIESVRSSHPHLKIVVGGAGAPSLTTRQQELADAVVVGEGEQALVALLKNENEIPGVNGRPPVQLKNLEELPLPDYSDLDLERYGYASFRPKELLETPKPFLYFEGSRGCVRKCSFCSVPAEKPGYRYRKGKSIANELISYVEQHEITRFRAADSLINGSLRQMREQCRELIRFREEGGGDFNWGGYFIIRKVALAPSSDFDLLARSNCNFVSIGIESGSEKIRKQMNKNFVDEDIDYTLNEFARVGIRVALLFLVGYPSETEDDFQETLNFLTRHQKLIGKPIISIKSSPKVDILEVNSQLNREKDLYGLEIDSAGQWASQHVNNDIAFSRYLRFIEHGRSLGFNVIEKKSIPSVQTQPILPPAAKQFDE